jgi:hypothetical protein
MALLPTPVRAAIGLAAVVVEQARTLPDRALELPVLVVSTALQFSVRVQQRYAELALRGDELLGRLHEPPEEPPSWATFDEDEPEAEPAADTGAAAADTSELAADTGEAISDTGAAESGTGAAESDTGAAESGTGAAAPGTGAAAPDTGAAASDTGAAASDAGEAKPARRRAKAARPPMQPEPSPFDTATE